MSPVREEIAAVAAGADVCHMNPLRTNSRLQEDRLVGFPQIRLVFSGPFSIFYELSVVFFRKCRQKLPGHFLSHLKAVLTDAGPDARRNVLRTGPERLCHSLQRTVPLQPE